MSIGIYKIQNCINQKVYIGQSVDIKRRWKSHRTSFNTQDYPIYRAMRKYGLDNFSFEIVEECDKSQLNEREIYWISYYQSNNPDFGYNLTKGGQYGCPIKLNDEDVYQIIKMLKETSLTQAEIAQQFNVSQRTISGINLGQQRVMDNIDYPVRKANKSIKNKKRKLSLNKDTKTQQKQKYKIRSCSSNRCKRCGKIITSTAIFCTDCFHIEERVVKERPTREELKDLIRTYSFVRIGEMYNVSDNAIRKWCKSYDLPTKKAIINKISAEDWDKDIFIPQTSITKNNSVKTEPKKVGQYDLQGNLIQEFPTAVAAAKALGKVDKNGKAMISHISQVCRGLRKTAYGFIWKYL